MDPILRGAKIPAPRYRSAPLGPELQNIRGFHGLQTFFPTLAKLYRLSKHQTENVWLDSRERICTLDISGTSGPCRLGLVPNVDVGTAVGPPPIRSSAGFLKVTHLLDPIRWMKGLYSLPKHSGLPWHGKTWTTAWNKLQDPWNQAYVETMASYALARLREEGVSPHFNHFYGAFCARADTYRYNLTEEFTDYRTTRWFWHGIKKGLFRLRVADSADPEKEVPAEVLEELLREPSVLGDSDSEGSCGAASSSSSEVDLGAADGAEMEAAFGALATNLAECDLKSLHSDSLSGMSFEEGGEEEGSDASMAEDGNSSGSSSEDPDQYRVYGEFSDFPVMLIAVEANRGTMDSLLEDHTEVGAAPGTPEWELRWSAWLFQVVAALSVAQDVLGFTHNDLHTNNVVWSPTEEEYLVYTNRAGAVFRVPTFGKLFRIIDFGRSILRINQNMFISDDFRAGNDADGQYCFKPLHPRPRPEEEVWPNPSFDLCRLAVSLFDSLFPDEPAEKKGADFLSKERNLEVRETVSPLYNALWSWMIDDKGANVLIDNLDGSERFPDFGLYRHIAAHVHAAIPARQFSKPVFDQFQVAPSSIEAGVKRWSLFA